jgi:hypothetical protein
LSANLWSILILAMLSFGATNFGSYSADRNRSSFVPSDCYLFAEAVFDCFGYFCMGFVFIDFSFGWLDILCLFYDC